MPDKAMTRAARALLAHFRMRGLKVAAAESCTGGLLLAALTEIPGSSDVVERGFVAYSNDAKRQMLGVPARTLSRHGAVSREAALAMAKGALRRSAADLAVAITGIAGPSGGTRQKPVGLVHIAAAARGGARAHRECRFGAAARAKIQELSVLEAFEMLESLARRRPRTKKRRKSK